MKTELTKALEGLDQVLESLEKSQATGSILDEAAQAAELAEQERIEAEARAQAAADGNPSEALYKSIESSLLKTADTLAAIGARFEQMDAKVNRMGNLMSVPRSTQGVAFLKKSLGQDDEGSFTKISQNTQAGRSVIKEGLMQLFDSAEGDLQKSLGREMLGFDAEGQLSQSTASLLKEKLGVEIS